MPDLLEQTSGNVYGVALAKEAFVVMAFDRSFQGASGGEPRFIEDPTLTVEDFRHVADYLVTLPYVDEESVFWASAAAAVMRSMPP
ncbi:MAG TPA: hypothetical protein VE641_05270 [Chthoniobacterales bacterium]|nr:hypothetical protein [Chthoniobacterales bacterium]